LRAQRNKRSRISPRSRYLYRDGRMGGRLPLCGVSLPSAPFEARSTGACGGGADPRYPGGAAHRLNPAARLATTGS